MAQLLVTDHTVTALAAGATATFAPGLNDAAGVSLLPNVVMPDRSTPIAVQTVTKSLVTVINNGTAPATAIFRTQQEFSTTDDPAAAGSQWIWQGLGDGGGGSSASGEYKQSVRAATTTALAANTRVGNVLTANAPGALGSIDTVALVVGDRLLVKNETPKANNGIYVVTSTGSGGTAWVLTRSPDADTSAEVTANMWTTVEDGTDPPAGNKHTGYLLATENPITLNATDLDFIRRWVFDLGGTYQNGAAAAAQFITLDSTRNAVVIRDGSVPIGAAGTGLFGVFNNAGTVQYLSVTSATGASWNVNTPSLQVDDSSEAGIIDVSRSIIRVAPTAYNNSGGAFFNSELTDAKFDLSHTVTFGNTTLPTQRAFLIQAPTYAANAAKTITTAATVAITGAPIAGAGPVTLTNAYALWIQDGQLHVDGAVNALAEIAAGTTAGTSKLILYDNTQTAPAQFINAGSTSGVTLLGVAAPAAYLVTTALPLAIGVTGAAALTLGANNTASMTIAATGALITAATRFTYTQGANVASANNLVLGTDGNQFLVTGTTQVNLIANTGWANGSEVVLIFNGVLTVKTNQATSGANVSIKLAGGADLTTGGDFTTLTLVLCNDGVAQFWFEKSRVISQKT